MVGQHVGQSMENGSSSQSGRPMAVQVSGRKSSFSLKQSGGQPLIISLQGVGAGDGSGDGIMVGEQIGGDPSGDSVNMGLSGRHSKAQHEGHPMPVGVGNTSQSGLLMLGSVQLGGREASS
jgi:hypothetical protein